MQASTDNSVRGVKIRHFMNTRFSNGGRFSARGSWKHGERTIDTDELIIVIEGVVHMFVGDEKYSVSAGEALHIKAGERHGGVKESAGVSFFWLHYHPSGDEPQMPVHSRPQNHDRVELLCKELLHYSEGGYPEECASCLIRVLLHELARCGKEEGRLISEVKEYIRYRKYSSPTVAEISEKFGYSPDYLTRAFKLACGRSLKKYIDEVILLSIKRDLSSSEASLHELSERYGFADYKYFLKYFKYHEGLSPSEYRETYYKLHTN